MNYGFWGNLAPIIVNKKYKNTHKHDHNDFKLFSVETQTVNEQIEGLQGQIASEQFLINFIGIDEFYNSSKIYL